SMNPSSNSSAKTKLFGRSRKIRPSTQDLLNELRRELWAKAVRSEHLSDFMNAALHRTKPINCEPNLRSTIFAAAA
ncbi:MAG: hypothetical protein WCG76_07935, partial [Verrucomicrobiota bacterium]